MHIAADVWLAKQEAVPILLMYYFTLKHLIEYKESWLAEISNELGFCQLNYNKDIPFAKVQDVNFRSASKLNQRLEEAVEKRNGNALCLVQKEKKQQ